MITGLCSPGPKYALPTTFAKASIKTKHPTWGTGGSGAFKDGRLRSEEVRFHSRRHMRVFIGHYGPGPQYDVPSSIGGATGNYIASTQRLLDNCAVATGHRATLSAADVGGQPIFNTTPGSHADATRRGGTAPALGCTNFWRSNVMVQPHERLTGVLRKDAPPNVWTEHKASLGQTKLQEEMKASLRERYREVPKAPFRMVTDMLAEPCAAPMGGQTGGKCHTRGAFLCLLHPCCSSHRGVSPRRRPLAANFGSGSCRTDYGGYGGVEAGWRESKIYKVT